jgi:putative endonuclease
MKSGSTTRLAVNKQFDRLNRLLVISNAPSAAAPLVFGYALNDANQRVQTHLQDGTFWVYNYDSLGQVTYGKKFWPDWTSGLPREIACPPSPARYQRCKHVGLFCYVYVLRSSVDGNFYVGLARDLKLRFDQHQAGRVRSTAARRPLELVYYEACRNIHDAAAREKYLKTAWGKRYVKGRLKRYLTG